MSIQSPIGGKIVVLSSSLPSVGVGALKNREDAKILGTTKVRRKITYVKKLNKSRRINK